MYISQHIDHRLVNQVACLLDDAERIVITCHKSPDGDAIGSSLALYHLLASLGKEARVVTPDRPPRSLRSLPGIHDIIPYTQKHDLAAQLFSDADLIFCLDFNSVYRVDRMSDLLRNATARKIMVDHHEHPEPFTAVTISHPEMSSTCVLLYHLICQLGYSEMIDRNIATCIYTGMMTDTGNFSYNSNDPELYFIITRLLETGINKDEIYKQVMNTKKESVLKLISFALAERMIVFPELHTAFIKMSRSDLARYDYEAGDDESLVNQPLSIEGIVYSVYMREDPHQVKVSTRSTGNFRADLLCQNFYNGGGHVNAAGGELKCSLSEAEAVFESTMPTIKEYLKENYRSVK